MDDSMLGRKLARELSNISGSYSLSDDFWCEFYYQSGKQLFEAGGSLGEDDQPSHSSFKKGFTEAYHASYSATCEGCEE